MTTQPPRRTPWCHLTIDNSHLDRQRCCGSSCSAWIADRQEPLTGWCGLAQGTAAHRPVPWCDEMECDEMEEPR